MSKNVVQTLELHQACCYDHFPEEHVPVTSHSAGEETLPNIRTEPPQMQLHDVSSSPIIVNQKQHISTCPSAHPHEEVIGHHEVSLLFPKLNKSKDLKYSSQVLPSTIFTIFVDLLWILFSSFIPSLYYGAQNCTWYLILLMQPRIQFSF